MNEYSINRAKSADPYDQLYREKKKKEELDKIRLKSRAIWSRPDTSETTHGFYFQHPMQNQRTPLRPTSRNRRNNPHPKLVFLCTGMKEIPDAYGAPKQERTVEVDKPPSRASKSSWHMQNLSDVERQGAGAFLKIANDEAKENAFQAVRNYRSLGLDEHCPHIHQQNSVPNSGNTEYYPSLYRFRQAINNDKGEFRDIVSYSIIYSCLVYTIEYHAVTQALKNPHVDIKLIDERIQPNVRYRTEENQERFHRRHHSCILTQRPYRGDFSIHPDWNPQLSHHRLTCLC
ncbi:unnamed protein product [Didymodactylos carnosus]|uniref:Uncharacterized protein n=1 Tax=Didymodactylos carnosus TaxID=1234261 RepID=A0A813Z7G9_9BILA|nr:unnamed protein product [Didymodactylos carnosus]CAF0894453.1 unnamed protein product [Didymodactylos carnosus]CAF3520843.1 unnamed protein product [Didymodactylos carnosus]CAF3678083.1 unnamed protein product [Didymodactylos carnosus]